MLELDYKNSGYGGLFAWMGHPEQKKLPHMHTDVELNFVCHGQVTYLIGGKIQVITEHDLVIFWAVTPHCIIAADEATRLGVVPSRWATFCAGNCHRSLSARFCTDRCWGRSRGKPH